MKVPFGDRLFSGAVVLVMTAVLLTLAVLQYRWSNQISRATSERMEVDLETTLMRLRDDFYHEIAGYSFQLQLNPAAGPGERQKEYAQQYQAWVHKAANPSVIANVFVMQQDSKAPGVFRLDAATSTFRPAALPERFTRLQQHLTEISAELEVAARRLQSKDELRRNAEHPLTSDDVALQFPVMIDQDVPALAQAVYHHLAGRRPSTQPSEIDWMILELNSTVITEQILPRLVHQYFGSAKKSAYLLAVVRGKESQHAIYASDPEFPGKLGDEADEDIRFFGTPFGPALRGSDMILLPAYHTQTPDGRFHETNDLTSSWPVRVEPIHYTPEDDDWHMLARHRKGSLEAAVADMKRRNLAMSFAVLLLLAGSMLMLLVSSRRAQTLARLQMDFVTAISHELRTPLTVISSAADNISDGVVGNQERMEQYGGAIKKAAQQLIHLVEQILMYAATSNNRHRYNMAPVTVAEIVDTACANTACILEEAGVTLDLYVDPQLPPLLADEAALAHCLQNLITNAVKYGGEQRWVGIRARLGHRADGAEEIQIRVEDRGAGIDSREMQHIFEPFYRTPSAVASQIRGTGLGLALARTIARGMGGELTLDSIIGHGSSFVLHLPPAHQFQAESTQQLTAAMSD